MRAIVCGHSGCPICGRVSEVLIGPCFKCTEHFDQHGSFARVRWVGPAKVQEAET